MKLLRDILYGVRILDVAGNTNVAIDSITMDSRKGGNFSLFVAIKGTQHDGHLFIAQAIEKGAVAVICEEIPKNHYERATYVRVADSAEALGIVASNFYGNPSESLKLVGITGTNGKTTVATLLYDLFMLTGHKCGLISTVKNKINGEVQPATLTTPDAISLNRLMAEMVKKGCTHCFMEVSSIAVDQKRIAGLKFEGAVFTNLTHDHLDYHGTFENYLKAKKAFFDGLKASAFALINIDDKHARVMVQNCNARKFTYSLTSMADFKAKIIERDIRGMLLNINHKEVWTKLSGVFNASNVLAVFGVATRLGMESVQVLTAISNLEPVEGRFNTVISKQGVVGVIDYAHTPDALQNILEAIHEASGSKAKVITVVGCGGDRDKTKRPVMGKIACRLSSRAIFTSDNPRSEEAVDIIADMQSDLTKMEKSKMLSITDREEAIKTAVALAEKGDIILIAGKGHEKYQEIKGVKHDFDDRKVLLEIFKNEEA
ncbi:MAG: UDP-N-acetylmuramoyl-L-alanyl-D-glutamate--2,6-diaminopimelate ligase [Flavobacteriales bacterium]|nr:UDP-N-acetylmuramoyl-L-alanyl-D-glutamate--2,6-diaminopimelate ligase [Flavobacteriales bacterium]